MQPLDVLGARVVLCGPRGWCTELRQQSAVPLAPELLIEAPGGKDDGIAIDWAIRNDAFIVTNDRYLEHLGQFPPGRSDAYLMKFAWSPNVDQTWSFALTDADKMRAYSMRPQVVPAHTDSAIRSKGRGRGRGRGGRGLGLLPSAITSGSPAGGSISVAGQRERGGVVRLPVYRARPTSGPLVGAREQPWLGARLAAHRACPSWCRRVVAAARGEAFCFHSPRLLSISHCAPHRRRTRSRRR